MVFCNIYAIGTYMFRRHYTNYDFIMKDLITITEKTELDLDGEVIRIYYNIVSPEEFDYLRSFSSYSEARKYIKETYGI